MTLIRTVAFPAMMALGVAASGVVGMAATPAFAQIRTPVDQMSGSSEAAYTDAIQKELKSRGYYHGPIDGIIGSGTRGAIRQYERDVGLPPTGVATKEVLEHMYFSRPDARATASSTPPRHTDGLSAAEQRALVRTVQSGLAERGYAVGDIDGLMGTQTRSAIRDYQGSSGLPVDGKVSQSLAETLGGSMRTPTSGTVHL